MCLLQLNNAINQTCVARSVLILTYMASISQKELVQVFFSNPFKLSLEFIVKESCSLGKLFPTFIHDLDVVSA